MNHEIKIFSCTRCGWKGVRGKTYTFCAYKDHPSDDVVVTLHRQICPVCWDKEKKLIELDSAIELVEEE